MNSVSQNLVDAGHVKRMIDALVHRGHDDEGLFCEGSIGLGHRRLSIIDLTENGCDPFLDHRLAEFAFSLPVEYLYSNGEHRPILKHILRRWISEPVLTARKHGFVVPLYEWMLGPWRPLVQEYLSRERIRAVGALDNNVVAAEVDRFYRYEGVGAEKLLLMLNFQMWAERWYCT